MAPVDRIFAGRLLEGDCLELLKTLPDNSIDSCCSDPPYHLTSIVKRFGAQNAAPAKFGTDGAYARAARGFMGQTWDGGDIAFRPELWAEVLRVLKPGGHLLAFSGTRTYHRMACAIEDAGFEIRDQIGWTYGSGFPKSHNLDGEWEGWGSALKPAWEPIAVARKPLVGTIAANVLEWGTGALNTDGCRIDAEEGRSWRQPGGVGVSLSGSVDGSLRNKIGDRSHLGRFPANIIHDGSDEVLALFPQTKSGTLTPDMNVKATTGWSGGSQANRVKNSFVANEGSAARFFYQAKASKKDRRGSTHPTVKPISLIRYLCRLVTPPGGTVLDPFAGSGTLAEAAALEDFDFVLIEREAKYCADIRNRILEFAAEQMWPGERTKAPAPKVLTWDDL